MKPRYAYKYPRTNWNGIRAQVMSNRRGWWYSIEKAKAYIENEMRSGYTSEPWMQLVEITSDSMTVIAECEQGGTCDISPLQAAGLLPRSIT